MTRDNSIHHNLLRTVTLSKKETSGVGLEKMKRGKEVQQGRMRNGIKIFAKIKEDSIDRREK